MPPQKRNTNTVSTGFQDIDKLFVDEGLYPGSTVLLRSDPTSSSQEFLLMMVAGNIDRSTSTYISTAKREPTIKEDLGELEVLADEDVDIVEAHYMEFTDIIDLMSETTETGLFIIDKINDVVFGDVSETEILQQLNEVAVENDCVILMNDVVEQPHNVSDVDYPQLTYNADYLFSFTKQYTQDKAMEKFWLERVPVGAEFKDTHSDVRMIQINNSEDKLTLDTGGTI